LTRAIAPLADLSGWARGNLLVIVLLVLGAILFTRLAEWARGRIMARIDDRVSEADELVRSEAAKHHQRVGDAVSRRGHLITAGLMFTAARS
jgi:moderate conductance mechanosensitive channel